MARREELSDAAIRVCAAGGLKGLTHRAVDAAAEVPPGTTSNYFRRRTDLVAAVAARLEERDLAVLDTRRPDSLDAMIDAFSTAIVRLTVENRDVTRVRLMLLLEAPDTLTGGHLRLRELAEASLRAYGVAEPERTARAVVDYLDGVVLHTVVAGIDPPPAEAVAEAVRRLVREA